MSRKESVSLCMIVRDEAQWLEECLESVAPIVSEMIIVDTGSVDSTVSIAEKFGARVFHHTWTDDFAAARNVSIEQATGRWILVLDADERIDASQHGKFRALLKHRNGYYFRQRHYTDQIHIASFVPCAGKYPHWERKYAGYFDTRLCRLFPNDPRLRYERRVHELIEPAIARSKEFQLLPSKIILHHYGQTAAAKKAKNKFQKYEELGEQKLEEGGASGQTLWELGIQHLHNKNFERSVELLKEATRLLPKSMSTWRGLAAAQFHLGQFEESIDSLGECLAIDAKDPDCHANLAITYEKIGEPLLAEGHFKRSIELRKTFINGYFGLARFYLSTERAQLALSVMQEASKICPGNEQVQQMLETCKRMVPDGTRA